MGHPNRGEEPRNPSAGRSWPVRVSGIVLATLIGAFLGASAYTFLYAEGAAYLSNDPEACVNCHIMRPQFDSWVKSSHHAVATCNDCHIPHGFPLKYLVKMENGYAHSSAFTLQNFDEPIRIRENNLKVLQENCIECHEDAVGMLMAPTAVHSGEDARACVRCHLSVGHAAAR
ncbi:MAG: cytochrome c nitrite reductase small subunit [Candidatus Eisenbacteria bacterium]|nr:cytochrome c nitrite reductase small subunit [Candidatus Latescibacterota bacterium]MBD3302035.1 cytochrome c nitrite reductase small subunit [Candidatus Eisenbacteria bacterium]